MKRAHLVTIVIAAMAVAFPGTVIAQDEDPLYVAVSCMKSSAPDYEQMELEVWQPVHQWLVNEGKRESWALYRVVFGDRSKCDYYTAETYRGKSQLNAFADYAEAFAAVHRRKDAAALGAKTMASREQVSTELWVQVDQTEIRPFRFAVVNRMYAADPVAYESMESDVFKPGQEVLIEGGYRSGWAVYALVSPIGSSIPYNYGTVDFVNELGPVPMAEAMMTGNPDRDLDAMSDLLALRDHVLSETWALIGATEARTED